MMKNIKDTVTGIISKINNDKFFLGFLIIVLNLAPKFINLRLNNFHQKILQDTLGRELLIFAIAFVGTRDLLVSILMSVAFILINDYFFNEESNLCIVPEKYRDSLRKAIDQNNDDEIDDDEVKQAINLLNRVKKQNNKKLQREAYMTFMNNL